MILHLIGSATWSAVRGNTTYSPASLATEGFVHCTGDGDTLLVVANSFYRDAPGDHVAMEIDEDALTSEVRWEAPAHPDGRTATADEPRFPHVYGPIDVSAVRRLLPMVRSGDGTYTGYDDPMPPS